MVDICVCSDQSALYKYSVCISSELYSLHDWREQHADIKDVLFITLLHFVRYRVFQRMCEWERERKRVWPVEWVKIYEFVHLWIFVDLCTSLNGFNQCISSLTYFVTISSLTFCNHMLADAHCKQLVDVGIVEALLSGLAAGDGAEPSFTLQHAVLSSLRNLAIPGIINGRSGLAILCSISSKYGWYCRTVWLL